MLHRVFISYHHKNDQMYKEILVSNYNNILFIDGSVDTGDIPDDWTKLRYLVNTKFSQV